MRLFLELRDHADVLHQKFKCDFDSDHTLKHLENKIFSVCKIAFEYQRLFSESGEEIDGVGESLLQSFGLKHGSKVIIKHTNVSLWSAYLFLCETVKDVKKIRSERTKFANQAMAYSKNLEKSGFFNVYADFTTEWANSVSEMMSLFVDKTRKAFEQSATTFFSKMYPNSKIDFKDKKGGTRAGIVVGIKCNDEEIKYYMKTYHHAGSSNYLQNTSKIHLPDVREMFAYRLLEIIGAGPVVFFPYYAGSTFMHYIATKEVAEFEELEKLEDVGVQNKIVVEAYLLLLILGIRDLNEENFGFSKEKCLSIVDFYVPDADNFLRRTILDDFKHKSNFRGIGKATEILTEISLEERTEIAKDALPRWSGINNMTSNIIGIEKNELRKNGIKFGTATNDVDNYVKDIKSNYTSLCEAFQ